MIDFKDVILDGLVYTVMGIVVVFLVLVVIMLVIKAMQLFAKTEEPKKAEAVPVQEASKEEDREEPVSSDDELIAVITAAISCMTGESSNGFVVRSYKKVSGIGWNNQGRREVLENRF